MNEVNVSGLDDSAIERLQRRADTHGWTVQDEIRYILTRGLDALEYAEKAFRELKETASPSQPELDLAAQRAKVEQMLNNAKDRDAQLLKELDQDLDPKLG